MILVSNASPLVNLARIGHLELLHDLFGKLLVPEAVWEEVVVAGAGQPGARLLEEASWVTRGQVQNRSLVQALRQELDAGEGGAEEQRAEGGGAESRDAEVPRSRGAEEQGSNGAEEQGDWRDRPRDDIFSGNAVAGEGGCWQW